MLNPLLPYAYSYKASFTRPAERQSARMSEITNGGLTRFGTVYFVAVPVMPYGNSGRQRVKCNSVRFCYNKALTSNSNELSIETKK